MMISIKYGSHFPVLTKLVNETTGPILELGMGLYSTPYLHWTALSNKRKLTSYDSEAKWVNYFRDSRHEFHEINLIEDWNTLPIDKYWDIVFIDHGPDERRSIEAERLQNNSKYIVIHDSESENDSKYGYSRIYPQFKYRFDYRLFLPNTTILSNFEDPNILFK